MTSKKNKRIVIVIIAVVLIALIGFGAFGVVRYISALKSQTSSGLKTQSNVILDDKSESTTNPDKVASINVNLLKNIKVEKQDDGKYLMHLGLTNGNEHQYMFTITVDNKEVYRSDLIPAGASLPEVELDSFDLKSGSYEAVVIFTVVNEKDNQSVMGSTGVELKLTVTE